MWQLSPILTKKKRKIRHPSIENKAMNAKSNLKLSHELCFFLVFPQFLLGCYATLHPTFSVRQSIHLSVCLSIHPSYFTFLPLMGVLAILLLPKCSTNLSYGPCPPTRNWGSCVSGLVCPSTCFYGSVKDFEWFIYLFTMSTVNIWVLDMKLFIF